MTAARHERGKNLPCGGGSHEQLIIIMVFGRFRKKGPARVLAEREFPVSVSFAFEEKRKEKNAPTREKQNHPRSAKARPPKSTKKHPKRRNTRRAAAPSPRSANRRAVRLGDSLVERAERKQPPSGRCLSQRRGSRSVERKARIHKIT